MDAQVKRIVTWVMVIALLVGSILVDYRRPLSSKADETVAMNAEQQATGEGQDGEQGTPETAVPQQGADETDITKYANVRLGSLTVGGKDYTLSENGQFVDEHGQVVTEIEVENNKNIRMKWLWDISRDNMDKVAKGKYIKIKLPGHISNTNKPIEFRTSTQKLGEFSVKDGYMTATFTEESYPMDYLEKGFFEFVERIIADDNQDVIETIPHTEEFSFTLNLKIKKKPQGTKPGLNAATFNNIFDKSGGQEGWTEANNAVYYLFRINHAATDEMFKDYTTVPKMSNVVLEDKFPDGLEIDPDKIEIKVPMYGSADSDPELPSNYILDYLWIYYPLANNPHVRDSFRLIVKDQDVNNPDLQDEKAFKAYIERENKNGNKPIVGIWDKSYLVVALGDLPNSALKYGDIYTSYSEVKGGVKDTIDSLLRRDIIGPAQAEKLKSVYAEDRSVVFLNIAVVGRLKNPNQTEFNNTAYLHYDPEKTIDDSTTLTGIKHLQGGAEGGVGKIKITVNKNWNRDPLPEAKFKLIAKTNGKPDKETEFTLTEAGGWTKTFNDMRVRDENTHKQIVYSLKEEPIEGYICTVKSDYDQNGNITFTVNNIKKELPKISIPVKKVWMDAAGAEITPDSSAKATIILKKNNQEVQRVTLPDNGKWEYTFTGLDQKDSEGNNYTYTVVEEPIEGYTASVVPNKSGDVTGGFTVTNTKDQTIDIIVTKKWVKSDGTTALPDNHKSIPKFIDLELINKANTSEVIATGKMTKTDKGWVFDGFRNLPLKDSKGAVIVYQVREKDGNGFDAEVADVTKEGDAYQATLTNRLIDQTTKIVVQKVWKNENGDVITTGLPEKVQVNVSRKGTAEVVKSVELNGNGSNPWKAEIELAKLDEKGDVIEYTVQETVPEGYFVSPIKETIENGNQVFTITNTKIKKVDLRVEKLWMDTDGKTPLSDEYEKIPAEIQVRLLANNGDTDKILTLKRDNKWKGSFADLPLQDPLGQSIAYSVQELNVPDKMVWTIKKDDSSSNSVIITNTKTDEVVNIKISKNWLDINNQPIDGTSGKLPEGVKFNVFANGTQVSSVTVTKSDNWFGSRTFPKLDKKGKEIVYTIKEVETPGYQVSIEQKAGEEYSFVATNKELPVPPAPIIPPLPEDPITIPPNTVIPPLPETPQDTIVIEDDEVALTDTEEEPLEEDVEEEENPDEEITDDLPRVNKDVPKTHDFLMSGAANPLAVGTVLMMGYGIKKILEKKRNKK